MGLRLSKMWHGVQWGVKRAMPYYVRERNYLNTGYGEVNFVRGIITTLVMAKLAYMWIPGAVLGGIGVAAILGCRMIGWVLDRNRFFHLQAEWSNDRNPFVHDVSRKLFKVRKP